MVLLATFGYVFNDFLNVEIASLSRPMRDSFSYYIALTLLFACAVAAGRCIRTEKLARRSLSATANALGELPCTLKCYRALWRLTILVLIHGSCWLIVMHWLMNWQLPQIAMIEGVMLALSAAVAFMPIFAAGSTPANQPSQSQSKSPSFLATSQTTGKAALMRWRLRQILFASRTTKVTLAFAVPFILLAALSALAGLPPFVGAAAGLVAGYLVGFCLCLQMAEDLEYAWFERCLGVTHEDFISAYERSAVWLAAGASLVIFILVALAGLATHKSGPELLNAAALSAATAGVPALIAPGLLLQIDGRRVFVTGLILLIVSLFIGTAIVASWFSLLLIPLLGHFAKQHQAGRFYRA
jgi:hypothetical protein